MGDSESASHEWIELHNTGSESVDVAGWVLSDGANLAINLSGIIAANSHAVLERTSEESAPGSAFLVYSGALVNTGATLTLRRADNSIEDQVAGGENWEHIGGDNTTKESAQLTTAGWVTAVPTPGALNNEQSSKQESEKTSASTAGDMAQPSKLAVPTVLTLSDPSLRVAVEAPQQVYVNQKIDVSAIPSGTGKTLMNSLSYDWNFGDGYTASGQEVSHVYAYPGTYLVTIYAEYKRQQYEARHEITVLPVNVSLTRNDTEDLQLHNDSPYEIDISGYRVSGSTVFVFPPRSLLLERQTVTLAKEQVGTHVRVYDASGTLLVTEGSQNYVASYSSTVEPLYSTTFNRVEEGAVLDNVASQTATIISIPSATSSNEQPNESWPYLALLGVMGLGVGVLRINPKA